MCAGRAGYRPVAAGAADAGRRRPRAAAGGRAGGGRARRGRHAGHRAAAAGRPAFARSVHAPSHLISSYSPYLPHAARLYIYHDTAGLPCLQPINRHINISFARLYNNV